MNHGHYGVYNKYTILILNHQKFASNELFTLQAWGLSVANFLWLRMQVVYFCIDLIAVTVYMLKYHYKWDTENTVWGVGSSGKYSMRQSWVLYWRWDPTSSTVFFYTSHVSGAISDLLFCIGGIVVMDPEHDTHKQLKAIVIITPRIRDRVH